MSKLFGNDFTVEYQLDKSIMVTNALSRCDKDMSMAHALSMPAYTLFDDFRKEAESLQEIASAKKLITQGKATVAWTIVDSLKLHEGHVLVPTSSALIYDSTTHVCEQIVWL